MDMAGGSTGNRVGDTDEQGLGGFPGKSRLIIIIFCPHLQLYRYRHRFLAVGRTVGQAQPNGKNMQVVVVGNSLPQKRIEARVDPEPALGPREKRFIDLPGVSHLLFRRRYGYVS